MKQILPMLMLVAAPAQGLMAQNQSGLDMTNFDKSVRPRFLSLCHGWMAETPPAACRL